MPIQLDFIPRRLVVMADQDPALRTRQPWQAAYTRDYGWLGEVITKHYHGDDSLHTKHPRRAARAARPAA